MAGYGTVDSLQIEIGASSSDAVSNIDKLASSLANLKSVAKGGAGLTAAKNQIEKLGAALRSVSEQTATLDKLSSIFQRVGQSSSGMGTAASALKQAGAAAKSAKADYSALTPQVDALAKEFAQLPPEYQKAATAAANAQKAINGISGQSVAPSLDQARAAMYSLSVALQKAASTSGRARASVKSIATAYSALPVSVQRAVAAKAKYINSADKVIRSNKKLEASNQKASKSFGAIKSAALSLAAISVVLQKIYNSAAKAVNSINEYIENVNLFQVSMGEFYEEASAYADLVNKKMGIDPSEWMRNQGVFMSMAKGFGLANDKAYQLSEGLTELSYDISSLYNEDVESAAKRLQSALAGEIEPIRRLGISITQATLQEYALSKGIQETVTNMTEQEKALLRSLKIIEDANRIGAVGDFAKTLESPANAIRILKQQITQLARAIGSVLLPILTQIIPWIQAFVSVITDAIKALASFVGFTMPDWGDKDWEDQDFGFGDTEDAIKGATGAAKEFKRQLMGIDELTVLQEPASGGAGGAGDMSDWAAGLEIPDVWDKNAISEIETQSDRLKKIIQDLAERLTEPFKSIDFAQAIKRFVEFFNTIRNQADQFNWSDLLFKTWDAAVEMLGAGVNIIVKAVAPLIEALNIPQIVFYGIDLLGSAFETVASVIRAVTPGITEFVEKGLVPIFEWVGEKIADALSFLSEQLQKIKGWFAENTSLFTDFFGAVGALVGTIWELVEPLADPVWAAFKNVVGDIVDFGLTLIGIVVSVAAPLVNLAATIADIVQRTGLLSVAAGILSGVFSVFSGVISGVLDFLGGFLTVVADVISATVNAGRAIVEGLLGGIADALGNIFGWLKEHLVDPIVNGVKTLFGIHSPSTVFAEIGTNVIAGLLNGISGAWKGIVEFFGEGLSDLWETITSFFSLDKWKKTVSSIYESVKASWNDTVSFWTKSVPQWWSQNVAPWFTLQKWAGIAKNIGTAVKSSFSSMVTEWKSSISSWWSRDVSPWFSVSKWKDLGKSALDGLFNGLSNIGNKVKSWGNSVISKVKGVFDINSPSRVFRDEIGINLGLGVAKGILSSERDVLASVSKLNLGMQKEFAGLTYDIQTQGVPEIPDHSSMFVRYRHDMSSRQTSDVEVTADDFGARMQDSSDSMINMMMAAAQQIIRAIQENGNTVVNIGGREVTDSQNRQNRMYGRTLQNT